MSGAGLVHCPDGAAAVAAAAVAKVAAAAAAAAAVTPPHRLVVAVVCRICSSAGCHLQLLSRAIRPDEAATGRQRAPCIPTEPEAAARAHSTPPAGSRAEPLQLRANMVDERAMSAPIGALAPTVACPLAIHASVASKNSCALGAEPERKHFDLRGAKAFIRGAIAARSSPLFRRLRLNHARRTLAVAQSPVFVREKQRLEFTFCAYILFVNGCVYVCLFTVCLRFRPRRAPFINGSCLQTVYKRLFTSLALPGS